MIHRLRVRNFKSIENVDVKLTPVTVLVGRSGTGKSNFLASLRFLRDYLSSQKNLQSFQGIWPRLRPAISSDKPTTFEIEFSIAGINDVFIYKLTLGREGPLADPLEECLSLGDRVFFHQKQQAAKPRPLSQWLSQPELVEAPKPGPPALGRIPSISEVVIAFTALTSGIGCYAFSDAVLAGADVSQSRKAHGEMASGGLADAATNYLQVLKEIVSNLQDLQARKSIIGALQRVNPTISAVELNDIQSPTDVVVGHRINGKTLPLQLAQESDGFRRFYAHLLAIYQRPSKQTLLFEHPEDGIHPGVLSVLAEEIKAAPESGRGQVILTTHSPSLLDHFSAEQIRVVELSGFETRIGPISSEQKEAIQDNLLDTGELLTVDPARLQSEAVEA